MLKYIGDENCTGCMACYAKCPSGAIFLKKNDEGFIYPQIDTTKCTDCGLCIKTCPLNKRNEQSEKKVYSFQSSDKQLLRQSSSGGFFSTVALKILRSGGYVYGAALDSDFNLNHICVDKENELERLRGSKYLQSEIDGSFKDVKDKLSLGKAGLFTGTSCQIAGLKSYLGKGYDNLLTIDLVCHGVPTPLIFKAYLKYLENKLGDKITDFMFRDKKYSWHVYNVLARCTRAGARSKNYIGKWEEDPFMRGFLREYFLRKSCHNCKWANPDKPADITMADFWGYKKHKELKDTDEGISMVMIHTEKGRQMFESLDKTAFKCVEVPVSEAVNGNPALNKSFPESPLRKEFWEDFKRIGFSDELVEKYLYKEELPLSHRPIYMLGGGQSVLFKIYNFGYRCAKKACRIVKKQ